MYESFYGLSGPPFRLSPDPEFFFGSKGHTKALAYLRYGITQKEGFVVITGAPGTGKTTLARALLKELGKEKVVVSEINTTHLESDDMLRLTAASFGLPHDGVSKSTLLKSLESFFIGRFRAGYHALLLVDESQNLPAVTIEELRMLSNFHVGNHPLVQIFLMGQEQFRDTLQSDRMEQLRQRVVASCHLIPLDVTETREYIEHRLRVVGWSGDPKFSAPAFVRIFAITKGVPRRINTFCDRLLLFSSLEGLHEITEDTVNQVANELVHEVSAYGIDADEAAGTESGDSAAPQATTISLPEPPIPEMSTPLELSSIAPAHSETLQPMPTNRRATDAPAQTEAAVPAAMSFVAEESQPLPRSAAQVADSGVVSKWEANSMAVATDDLQQSRAGELSSVPVEVEKSVPELDTLVACFKYGLAPGKHARMGDPKSPLPSGMTEVLRLAVGKLEISNYLLSERFEGAPIATVRSAVRDYVKNVLLSGTADYYRRLGIPRDADVDLAKRHYKYLFRLFQPDQEKDPSQWNEIYARRINQAYATLRDPKKRASYDEFLATYEKRSGAAGSRISDTMVANLVEQPPPAATVDVRPQGGSSLEVPIKRIPDPTAKIDVPAVDFRAPQPTAGRKNWLLWVGLGVLLIGVVAVATKTVLVDRAATSSGDGAEFPSSQIDPATPDEPAEGIAGPDSEVGVANVVVTTFDGEAAPVESPQAVTSAPVMPSAIQDADTAAKAAKAKRSQQGIVEPSPATVPTVSAPAEVGEASENTPSAPVLSERDLRQTLEALTSAYEAGNLSDFMALFGPNASTNDRQDKTGIEHDYRELFASTDSRAMELRRLRWVRGANSASAKGDFKVSVMRKGSTDTRNFSGSIDIEFEKIDGQIKITGFHHSYVTDGAR